MWCLFDLATIGVSTVRADPRDCSPLANAFLPVPEETCLYLKRGESSGNSSTTAITKPRHAGAGLNHYVASERDQRDDLS